MLSFFRNPAHADDVAASVAAAVLHDDSTIRRTIDFNNGDLPIPQALTAGHDC